MVSWGRQTDRRGAVEREQGPDQPGRSPLPTTPLRSHSPCLCSPGSDCLPTLPALSLYALGPIGWNSYREASGSKPRSHGGRTAVGFSELSATTLVFTQLHSCRGWKPDGPYPIARGLYYVHEGGPLWSQKWLVS